MHSLGSLTHRKLCVAFALPKSMAMGEKEKWRGRNRINAKQIGALERQDERPARQARGCPAARASARAGGGLSTMTFQFGTFFSHAFWV